MKKFYAFLLIIAVLIISGCQATPTPLDPVSIQNTAVAIGNTAVAMAWTGVAETQIALTPPTPRPTIPPPTPDRRSDFEKCSQSNDGVRYVVIGSKYSSASLTWQNDTNGTEQMDRQLPICFPYSDFVSGDFLYISAQITSNGGTIECYILDGNRTISKSSASGFASIATCSGQK